MKLTDRLPLAAALAGVSLLMAAPVWSLNLQQAVEDALSAHPVVREKLHVYREILQDRAIAESGWRPSIDLEASTGAYRTDSPATGNSTVDYNSSRVELSLTQNLFNGYDTTNQIEQTRARARAALFDLYDSADNVALDVIKAYLEVLKQRRLYQLAVENVDSHEGILAQIRERNNSGVGRVSQLQQTEGRVARAHASLIAQQNNLQDALTQFHQLLGRYVTPEELEDPLLPELPPDDLNTLITQALQNHPAMQVAFGNIDASRSDYERARSTRYPTVDLRLAQLWGDDIGGVDGRTDETSLVLNLRYNFYNGGADEAQRRKKASVVYEQKEFAARVRRQIIETLRLARVADDSLNRQLAFLQQHVEKARQTVSSYREEFFIGQRDLIDLLDAENELNSARNQQTQARYDAMAARFRVHEALGRLFPALQIDVEMEQDNLKLVRLEAAGTDQLPLPTDEDADRKPDRADHCDNTLPEATVNTHGCAASGEVRLGYKPQNSAPTVGNDRFGLDSNGLLVIAPARLLENDSDPDGDALTLVDVGRPGNGRLAFDSRKNLVYRPLEGFVGSDKFSYTVSDGKGAASTAIVTLDIRPVDNIDLSKMHLVNFKYDSAELTDVSKEQVKQIIELIKGAKDLKIEIRTYTDSIGSEAYNLKLSDRRARALRELLVREGIDPGRIDARGMGESNPIADNATKSGQAINRRGEFRFKASLQDN
jgi:adhesin transport system outer membrane protein